MRLVHHCTHQPHNRGHTQATQNYSLGLVHVASQSICDQMPIHGMHCPRTGTYSDAVGATTSGTCTACPPNSTTPAAGAIYSFECSCDLGYTGSPGSCAQCEAGKYKDTVGSASCARCPTGTYLNESGATSMDKCVACPANSMSRSGSKELSDCRCQAGFAGPSGGTCTPCKVSEYKEDVGSHDCEICPQGTYGDTTSATACTRCPDQNQNSPQGSNSSLDCKCNDGYNGPNGGTCVACAAGKYWVYGNLEGTCVNCVLGKYHHGIAVIGDQCFDCPRNSNTASDASDDITDCTCLPGFSGNDGSACVACPAGTYKSLPGSGICDLCGVNTYSEVLNATLPSTCHACDANAQSLAGSNAAKACTCNAGWTGPDGDTCTKCTAGKYKPSKGPYSCFSCQPGKYSAATGAAAESVCMDCKSNSDSTEGASAPEECTCTSGYTLALNVSDCVECPVATYKEEQGNQVDRMPGMPDGNYQSFSAAAHKPQVPLIWLARRARCMLPSSLGVRQLTIYFFPPGVHALPSECEYQ